MVGTLGSQIKKMSKIDNESEASLLNMLTNVLVIISIVIGSMLIVGYFYIAAWLISRRKDKREPLSWLAMLFASLSVLVLFIAWMIHEPLAKDFFPVFFVISIVIGLVLRESAISPYKLAKFWSNFQNRGRNRRE
jgi:MFS family permease